MRNFSTLLGESPKNQGWKNMSFYFFNIKKSHFWFKSDFFKI